MIDPELVRHWQFLRVREVPGRGDCVVQRFLYTCGLLTNVKLDHSGTDYDARYCYASHYDAIRALQTWDGAGDPPGAWIKEKVSERLGPGARCEEHTETFFTPHIQYKPGTAELETETVYCCPDCKSPYGH